MGRPLKTLLVVGPLLAICFASQGAMSLAQTASITDWFKDAKYGVFMHFLPGNARQLEQVTAFDVERWRPSSRPSARSTS